MGRIILSICAVVVAVGLCATATVAISSQAEHGEAGQKTEVSQDPPRRNSPAIAAAPRYAAADKYETNCEQPQNVEAADLCVQVAMAVAAGRANDIAAQNLVWSKIGLLGLILTLGATAWAAWAASRAARVAERIVDGSERPYLIVTNLRPNFLNYTARMGYLGVLFDIRNIGGSPATVDSIHSSLKFETKEDRKLFENHLGGNNIYIIENGASDGPHLARCNLPKEGMESALRARSLVFRVNFSYVDLFGQRRNYFSYQYYFFHSEHPRFVAGCAPRVVDVPFDPYKWQRRRARLRSWYVRMRHRIVPYRDPNAT
jgi:hypothetical protein